MELFKPLFLTVSQAKIPICVKDSSSVSVRLCLFLKRCLDYVLDEIALNRKANMMVASHNEDTIKHTLRR